MASSFTWKLLIRNSLFNLDTYGMRAWRRAVETVLVPMLLLILSTSSSSSLLAISSLVMADPLMMAAGGRGNWGRELEPWLDSKGLPASSSGYLKTIYRISLLVVYCSWYQFLHIPLGPFPKYSLKKKQILSHLLLWNWFTP